MPERARDFNRWVRLTVRPAGGDLFLDYEDEAGVHLRGGEPVPVVPAQISIADVDEVGLRQLYDTWSYVRVPHGLVEKLRAGFSDRPESRPHRWPGDSYQELSVPWLLPVFVVAPEWAHGMPWERWLESVVFLETDLAARCVLLRHETVQTPRPLELPLVVGDGEGVSARWFAGVRGRRWYALSEAVREFGLRLPSDREPSDVDIVVRAAGDNVPVRRVIPWATAALVLTVARTNRVQAPHPPAYRPKVSEVVVRPRAADGRISAIGVMTQFVYALVHDFALHEIVWILRQQIPGVDVWVATDVLGNQALRLSRVMRRMVDDELAMPGVIGNAALREELRQLVFDFSAESKGLTAMAEFLSRRQKPGVSSDASVDFFAVAPTPPPRRADVALEAYDAFGVLAPMLQYERAKPLRRGWPYRLRVHIGSKDSEASAVVDDVPSFDDLLPERRDTTPWPIEVAVFAKRFELLSPAVRTIHLPVSGPASPVYFELRSPQESGPADLRIALYLHNNLLQSFVLEADVSDVEPASISLEKPRVRVLLAASGVDDFTGAPQVRARVLSVALNDDVGAGTHTVMVKGMGWREEVSLTGTEMNRRMERFRGVLDAASAQSAPLDADAALRQFAAIGRGLWDMLSLGDKSDGKTLEALRTGAGSTVQFVRHGGGRPFPWQSVYDYGLPEGAAFPQARICRADTLVRRQLKPGERGCPHFPGEDVVCIEGFWSARHRIELLREDTKGDGQGNAAQRVVRAQRACAPSANPLVSLGIGTPSGAADRFLTELQGKLGHALYPIEPKDAPVADLIWDLGKRPAVLVILSHLEAADEQQNLPALLRAFSPSATGDDISVSQLAARRVEDGVWQEPQRPLVLLLACQSARREPGDLTNLVDAFLQIGAAGVAGTECDVSTSLATEFANVLILGALDSPPVALGESARRFLHAALKAGQALPFAFTVYGDADLTIGRLP